MIQIQQTETYAKRFAGLRDRVARARIDIRIRRLSLGNTGDTKPVGEGVSESRVDHGPGYRVYFKRRGQELVVLLVGGDKSTQDQDIKTSQVKSGRTITAIPDHLIHSFRLQVRARDEDARLRAREHDTAH